MVAGSRGLLGAKVFGGRTLFSTVCGLDFVVVKCEGDVHAKFRCCPVH